MLNNPADRFVREFVGADRLLKSLRLHRISEVLDQPAVIIKSNEKPDGAKERMKNAGVHWAMLTDERDRFVGWISLEDIGTALNLRDIAEPPVFAATLDDKLNDALSMMLYSAIGNLAVLDERQKILGVVTFNKVGDVLSREREKQEKPEVQEVGDEDRADEAVQ